MKRPFEKETELIDIELLDQLLLEYKELSNLSPRELENLEFSIIPKVMQRLRYAWAFGKVDKMTASWVTYFENTTRGGSDASSL